ncbi:MAG: hypothetical protein ISR85_00575 [Kiritimatiellales bacterium]|nr:hypothetical protein [Kiritimatiellota bacterium]MBL7011406.1 hypothetical protein [Kiritimatiellales bacterium]
MDSRKRAQRTQSFQTLEKMILTPAPDPCATPPASTRESAPATAHQPKNESCGYVTYRQNINLLDCLPSRSLKQWLAPLSARRSRNQRAFNHPFASLTGENNRDKSFIKLIHKLGCFLQRTCERVVKNI